MSDSFVTPGTVACQVPLSIGFFQAGILEWVAISFSKGSSWPRDLTFVSCIGRQILYHWAIREPVPYLIDSTSEAFLKSLCASPLISLMDNSGLHRIEDIIKNFSFYWVEASTFLLGDFCPPNKISFPGNSRTSFTVLKKILSQTHDHLLSLEKNITTLLWL